MAKEKVVEMPVKEAETKEPETEPEKEEKKMDKKPGKARKVAMWIGGGLLAGGALALGAIKFALNRRNDPELPTGESCSTDSDPTSDVE